jgi:hypothetical protein
VTIRPLTGEIISNLPIQVRPIAGEGGRSFLIRLARANYLPFAYLRKFLIEPPGGRGAPSWDRLAAVTGRDAAQLRKILEAATCKQCGGPMPPPTSSFGHQSALYCSSVCRKRKEKILRISTTAPCRICHKPMRIQIGQRHRLCSSFCRRTAYLMRRGKQADPESDRPAERICAWCEKPLPPDSHKLKRFCLPACSQRAYRWNRRADRSQPPLTRPTCEFCHKTIERSENLAGPPRRWCSRACMKRASRGLDPATFLGPLTCEHCLTRFLRGPSRRARRWCSDDCRYRAKRASEMRLW